MMARTTSIIMQIFWKSNDACRREGRNVMFSFCFFLCFLKITLLAVDRFGAQLSNFHNTQRWHLQAYLNGVSGVFCGIQGLFSLWNSFQNYRQVLLPLVRQCARKYSKSEKMGAKFVRTTSTIQKRVERKLLRQPFTTCTVDVHPYKIFRYLVTG